MTIPPWVSAVNTNDGLPVTTSKENGEFCVTVSLLTGLLAYWTSRLKVHAVN